MPEKDQRVTKKASRPISHLQLSLIENSYNFLNQSLRHYRKASRNVHEWPFALLHITQSTELMVKQLLKETHPIFIYENIDHPKHTVSLEMALARLQAIGVPIGEKEKINIQRASDYRNRVAHYEVDLNKFEWKNIYAQLFEFVHFFHHKHLKNEIHTKIAKENWPVEARLMMYFRGNFVVYNGYEMHKDNPMDIVDAQRKPFFALQGQRFNRIKYGDEPGWGIHNPEFAEIPCHDCGVVKGQYHAENCDVEECPKCHNRLLGCGCGFD